MTIYKSKRELKCREARLQQTRNKIASNFSKSFKALENSIGQAKKALEKIGRSINSPPFSASISLGTVKIRFEVGYLTESKQRILNVLSLAVVLLTLDQR